MTDTIQMAHEQHALTRMGWFWVSRNSRCTITVRHNMRKGTSMICAFLEIGMSFIPPRILQKIFPPMVTGKGTFCDYIYP